MRRVQSVHWSKQPQAACRVSSKCAYFIVKINLAFFWVSLAKMLTHLDFNYRMASSSPGGHFRDALPRNPLFFTGPLMFRCGSFIVSPPVLKSILLWVRNIAWTSSKISSCIVSAVSRWEGKGWPVAYAVSYEMLHRLLSWGRLVEKLSRR